MLNLINAQNSLLIVAAREIRKVKVHILLATVSLLTEASSSTALMLWELLL